MNKKKGLFNSQILTFTHKLKKILLFLNKPWLITPLIGNLIKMSDNSVNIELGLNKKVKRAYGIDEIALVPGKRTLDYDLTDPSWSIGELKREVPIVASAMDSVVDVNTAAELTKLGALGVINMEGIQTRYENPDEILNKIASVGKMTLFH